MKFQMRGSKVRIIVILSLLYLTISSCKDKVPTKFIVSDIKEYIAESVFSDAQISYKTIYAYEYDGEKMKMEKSVTYTLMLDMVMDSVAWIKNYEYNGKGQLIKTTSFRENDNKPEVIHIYSYNATDSLNCNLDISEEGDTIYWVEFGYFPDGRQIVYSRSMQLKVDWPEEGSSGDLSEISDEELVKIAASMESRSYDTTIYRYEYKYEKDLQKVQNRYDKDNQLTEILEYEYVDNRISIKNYYSIVNGVKLFVNKVCYDYSKSNSNPDLFTLNVKNDTIGWHISEFENNQLLSEIEVLDEGKDITKVIYENGKESQYISINKKMNYKSLYLFTYDEKGNVKEEKRYSGDLTK